jgi:hypothetical protein
MWPRWLRRRGPVRGRGRRSKAAAGSVARQLACCGRQPVPGCGDRRLAVVVDRSAGRCCWRPPIGLTAIQLRVLSTVRNLSSWWPKTEASGGRRVGCLAIAWATSPAPAQEPRAWATPKSVTLTVPSGRRAGWPADIPVHQPNAVGRPNHHRRLSNDVEAAVQPQASLPSQQPRLRLPGTTSMTRNAVGSGPSAVVTSP